MKEDYHKWHSYYLNREFEMLVFGHEGRPLVLFPASRARYYQAKDEGLISAVSHLIESGKIKIYCPDSVDSESWYNYSIHPSDRVKNHNGYECLIIKDVIEFAKHETGAEKVGVAGCGFGAYHALNIALRHPDMIDSIISLDGSFDIKRFIYGYYDDNCYFNSPLDYLPGLQDEWYIERIRSMNINFGIGEYDKHLWENKRISGLLASKNINHNFEVIEGRECDWNLWRDLFSRYLERLFY